VNGGVLLRVPRVVDGNDHVDGTATKVPAILEHVGRCFANDERADVRESEDLVKRNRSEVGSGSWIG